MILTLASCLCSLHSHRINPVEGSTRKLQVSHTDSSISESEENGDSTRQTGFKHHWLGVVLHVCTLLTVVGWFGLLAGTTYLYYKYNADEENLIMSLKAFGSLGTWDSRGTSSSSGHFPSSPFFCDDAPWRRPHKWLSTTRQQVALHSSRKTTVSYRPLSEPLFLLCTVCMPRS